MSSFAFSNEKIEFLFHDAEVKQGSIVSSTLKVDPTTVQSIDIQKLKGTTIGKTIYVYGVTPLLKKDGSDSYEADAKVIFVEVPKANSIQDTIAGRAVSLSWNAVTVQPVEANQKFVFANFEVPSPLEMIKWVLVGVGVLLLGLAGFFGYKKLLQNKKAKEKRAALAHEMTSAKEYEAIVNVWKKKRTFVKEFPATEDAFTQFELVLFKYQFKQTQTEREKNEIISAYESFVSSIKGGLNGI